MEQILMWVSFALIAVIILTIAIVKIISIAVYRENRDESIHLTSNEHLGASNCSKTTPDQDFERSKNDGFKPFNC